MTTLLLTTKLYIPPPRPNLVSRPRLLCLFTRFTPTRVGNTTAAATARSPASVHPHACGEYFGKRVLFTRHKRFTPTRVGNTPGALR